MLDPQRLTTVVQGLSALVRELEAIDWKLSLLNSPKGCPKECPLERILVPQWDRECQWIPVWLSKLYSNISRIQFLN